MTLELELSPEIEEKLNQRSEAQGTSLEKVVASIVEAEVARRLEEEKKLARQWKEFSALAEELIPRINEGLTSKDDVDWVAEARREEEERLLAPFGQVHPSDGIKQ